MNKVIVLLSGGIDSAFAAYLLKNQGLYVHGLVLKIYDNVPGEDDFHRLEKLREILDIKIDVLDVRKFFEENIIQYFVDSYLRGNTPNPCAVCNPEIKFRFGFKFMEKMGFDLLATGHYTDKGKYMGYTVLKKAKDIDKSQEYFLARLPKRYLENVIFPLAKYVKEDLKEVASKVFPFLESPRESQDVCFLKGRTHAEFFEERGIALKGKMIFEGKVVRDNVNLLRYTRGQRRGIEFAAGERVYVTEIHPEKKELLLGRRYDLATKEFYVYEPLFYVPYSEISACQVKVRYSKAQVECKIKKARENRFLVELKKPLYTVTPGQLAVFYDGEYVLGSGWIELI